MTNYLHLHISRMILFGMLCVLLCSCSDDDYQNAIPADSIALVAMDLSPDGASSANLRSIFHLALGVDDLSACGLDLAQKTYLFETPDGLFGLCAKVGDEDDLHEFVSHHVPKQHLTKPVQDFRDFHFAVLHDSWMMGFSDQALLVIGPVAHSQFAMIRQRMVKWLQADDKNAITSGKMFQKLDQMEAPVSVVAQTRALPEQVRLPFTIGMPAGADASQVLWAATVQKEGPVIEITGETFSFVQAVDDSLKHAAKHFRPVTEQYVQHTDANTLASFFINMEGHHLLDDLRSDKGSQVLLAGVNTAIDMDNILRCVDGDVVCHLNGVSSSGADLSLCADLSSTDFLKDVDYWKKSCPPGTRIDDVGPQAYRFSDGKLQFYFGVAGGKRFYAGTSPGASDAGTKAVAHPLPASLSSLIKGQRLCLSINLKSLQSAPVVGDVATSLLAPLLGDAEVLIYHTK